MADHRRSTRRHPLTEAVQIGADRKIVMPPKRNDIVPLPGKPLQRTEKLGRHGEKYKPEHCDLICNMAQKGQWPEEWCAAIGITMSTLYEWSNKHQEFEDAVKIAWHILGAYYSAQLRTGLREDKRTVSTLLKMMGRRFPSTWGEKARNHLEAFEQRNAPDPDAAPAQVENMNDDQLRDEIRRLQERISDMEDGA